MKKITLSLVVIFATYYCLAQGSILTKTDEVFANKEHVWSLNFENQRVGEFWPVRGLNLISRDVDSAAFAGGNITEIQKKLGGVATAPDGMTVGSFGSYQMQGKCLSHGVPCGDGFVYDYGIIIVSSNGYNINFSHKREHDFDSLYEATKKAKGTLFFLPSILRNGKYLPSQRLIDKVLIRRDTPDGVQIEIVLFDTAKSYDQARQIILGLDRIGKSKTTHIYVLDGGPIWGQSLKQVNGGTQVMMGTANPWAITNYLMVY